MNALTDQFVRQHLQELRDEASDRRRRPVFGPTLRERIADAVSDLRVSLAKSIADRAGS